MKTKITEYFHLTKLFINILISYLVGRLHDPGALNLHLRSGIL